MKEAYLRGYYGYKNFGDELLLFGVIEYLFQTYQLERLIIEVENKHRIEKWIFTNEQWMTHRNQIEFVEIKQHKWRRLTHVMNLIGLGKYKRMFKFFGGGEVLTDERPFPHDGRNIPLLFNRTVRNGNFILLGGIGTPKRYRSRLLYKDLLHRAKELIIRDKTSYEVVTSFVGGVTGNKTASPDTCHPSLLLYEDFSLSILRKFSLSPFVKGEVRRTEGFKSSTLKGTPSFAKEDSADIQHYVLVNINTATCTSDNIHKIQLFCQAYPDHKIIFFPCDMDDDYHCFDHIKDDIAGIEMYDWTKQSLEKTIQLFSDTEAGIGSRLHFLLPLKFFNKPFQSIAKAEKVQKMINA